MVQTRFKALACDSVASGAISRARFISYLSTLAGSQISTTAFQAAEIAPAQQVIEQDICDNNLREMLRQSAAERQNWVDISMRAMRAMKQTAKGIFPRNDVGATSG